jgi:hypothetical protein
MPLATRYGSHQSTQLPSGQVFSAYCRSVSSKYYGVKNDIISPQPLDPEQKRKQLIRPAIENVQAIHPVEDNRLTQGHADPYKAGGTLKESGCASF